MVIYNSISVYTKVYLQVYGYLHVLKIIFIFIQLYLYLFKVYVQLYGYINILFNFFIVMYRYIHIRVNIQLNECLFFVYTYVYTSDSTYFLLYFSSITFNLFCNST